MDHGTAVVGVEWSGVFIRGEELYDCNLEKGVWKRGERSDCCELERVGDGGGYVCGEDLKTISIGQVNCEATCFWYEITEVW